MLLCTQVSDVPSPKYEDVEEQSNVNCLVMLVLLYTKFFTTKEMPINCLTGVFGLPAYTIYMHPTETL